MYYPINAIIMNNFYCVYYNNIKYVNKEVINLPWQLLKHDSVLLNSSLMFNAN